MAGNSKITELEILVRRIDEVQDDYELKRGKLDRDIRDDLINMLDRQVALLAGLIFDLVNGKKVNKEEIDRLLSGD